MHRPKYALLTEPLQEYDNGFVAGQIHSGYSSLKDLKAAIKNLKDGNKQYTPCLLQPVCGSQCYGIKLSTSVLQKDA